MRAISFLGMLWLTSSVFAADFQVDKAWALASAEGKTMANVYFHITSKQDAVLLGASSPVSKSAVLRSMVHNEQGMKIIDLPSVNLPANKKLNLTSEHREHVTLLDLNAALQAGKTFPLTLKIQTADQKEHQVKVKVQVKPRQE